MLLVAKADLRLTRAAVLSSQLFHESVSVISENRNFWEIKSKQSEFSREKFYGSLVSSIQAAAQTGQTPELEDDIYAF